MQSLNLWNGYKGKLILRDMQTPIVYKFALIATYLHLILTNKLCKTIIVLSNLHNSSQLCIMKVNNTHVLIIK